MLTKLEETSQESTGHSNPSQVASVGVSRVGGVETESTSSGGVHAVIGQAIPNPSTLAAALPNLIRHLRQPAGEREKEFRLQNQPTVVANTCTTGPSQTTTISGTHCQFADVSITSSQARPSHMQQLPTVLPSNSQSVTSKNSSMENKQLSDSCGDGSAVVAVAAKVPPSSADLSQPVPLPDLIKQGFIKPGVDCISCLIMVQVKYH